MSAERPGRHPQVADRGAGPGRDPGRRPARVLVQHHRRSPWRRKTTLAHQILFANATPERPALYFTVLGEPALKMLRYQQQFRFFDPAKLTTAVRFVNLSHVVLEKDLDAVLEEIVKEVEAANPGVVVVDSFRTVVRKAGGGTGEAELQGFVQRLALHLTSWQATTFLIGEYTEGELRDNPVFTVADGLFWLYQQVERNSIVRKLQVDEAPGPGVRPGPAHVPHHRRRRAGLPPHLRPHRARRQASRPVGSSCGIAELDAMMGGGIPEGDSLLIAGPSGSGKSVLATQFIAEGLRRGEPGIVAIFEEPPEEYAGGPPASAWISRPPAGRQAEHPLPPPLDLSVDETMREILDAVERTGAKRVVIDSLAGFEMALAPGFRTDFRESLYRMIGALTRTGVTVVSTVEVTESFTELALSPYAISFLSDDIIRHAVRGDRRPTPQGADGRQDAGGRPQQGHPRVRDHVRGLADRRAARRATTASSPGFPRRSARWRSGEEHRGPPDRKSRSGRMGAELELDAAEPTPALLPRLLPLPVRAVAPADGRRRGHDARRVVPQPRLRPPRGEGAEELVGRPFAEAVPEGRGTGASRCSTASSARACRRTWPSRSTASTRPARVLVVRRGRSSARTSRRPGS